MSLRYLVLPQMEAALEFGEAIGISASGPYVPELEERGIRHISLESSTRGMSLGSDLRAAWQLYRILKREQVDVLHTHNPKPGLYGRVVGRLAGVPIVVNTVHGLYATEDSSLLRRFLVYSAEWLASRFSDAELIQSPEDYALMTRLGISPRGRTKLLGNGVDLVRFNPDAVSRHRTEARRELGVEDDRVLVGMVGRLVAEKGVPDLIAAASASNGGLSFAVAGPHDPEKSDALSAEKIAEGEKAGVWFLGMRRDVERLYAAFDVFALPSHREGFPRAAMEAAASGLPVVATNIRGCRQVVDDGVNGYLFPAGDSGALLDRLESLGADDSLRSRMGEASVAKARLEFDERQVVERVMSTYREVATAKGLAWALLMSPPDEIEVDDARPEDAKAVARLHQKMIASGFLSSLGPRFLTVLYRALIADPDAVVLVVREGAGPVAFIAGVADTGAFYKRFLRSYALAAAWAILPRLLRPSVWPRMFESLRYGESGAPVRAELLSMAVAPVARRRGLGRDLIERLLARSTEVGVTTMKVVVGAENEAAISLYRDTGFGEGHQTSVHGDDPSWELVWRSG